MCSEASHLNGEKVSIINSFCSCKKLSEDQDLHVGRGSWENPEYQQGHWTMAVPSDFHFLDRPIEWFI